MQDNTDTPEWQLNNDQPMLICVDCHRLVPRRHPLQNRCQECHEIKTVGDNLWINLKTQADVSRNR